MKIEAFNKQEGNIIRQQLFNCCGCSAWVNTMMHQLPFQSLEDAADKANRAWKNTTENDWKEAFTHHPRIGDLNSLKEKFASTIHHTAEEQGKVMHAAEDTLINLQNYNDEYFNKFGFIFIICATGKTAEEMLEEISKRINNDPVIEIKIAAEEQHKIMHLRLLKLFS